MAAVRIINSSGRTLKLGDQPGWLRFVVRSSNGFDVAHRGDPPVLGAFAVPNSGRGTRRVDIAPYFDMGKADRYLVTAVVRVPELGAEIVSAPASINIINGTKIWEQNFGLPQSGTAASPTIVIRKYALVQALFHNQTELYFRLTDENEETVLKVYPLGPMLTFVDPEVKLDRESCLHLLFQVGARNFAYDVIRPDGETIVRHVYSYAASRPTLRVKDDGTVAVIGGVRILTRVDLPAENPDSATTNVTNATPPTVVGTNAPATTTNQPVTPPKQ
jgi:hypothetical protein